MSETKDLQEEQNQPLVEEKEQYVKPEIKVRDEIDNFKVHGAYDY